MFESVEDAAGGVVLLAVDGLFAPQNLLDDLKEAPDLMLGPWLDLLIAGRLSVLQNLDERFPADPKRAAHATLYGPVEVARLRMAGKREWP